jgi:hypothetical protein
MHPYLDPVTDDDGQISGWAFWCPGCATIDRRHGLHVFTVKDADGDPDQEWSFDGNASFEPSLAYERSPGCHLHLTDGKLRYYPDCEHGLAGRVVDLPEIPPGRHRERN